MEITSEEPGRTDFAALVRSRLNGLKPFERIIEQTTETTPPSSKTISTAAMTTNRITSLRELLHHCRYWRTFVWPFELRALHHGLKQTHSQGLFNTQIQDSGSCLGCSNSPMKLGYWTQFRGLLQAGKYSEIISKSACSFQGILNAIAHFIELWAHILQYNDWHFEAKEDLFSSYITLTHTSAVCTPGQIINDELTNQSMCFTYVIKRKFWFGKLVINHICRISRSRIAKC